MKIRAASLYRCAVTIWAVLANLPLAYGQEAEVSDAREWDLACAYRGVAETDAEYRDRTAKCRDGFTPGSRKLIQKPSEKRTIKLLPKVGREEEALGSQWLEADTTPKDKDDPTPRDTEDRIEFVKTHYSSRLTLIEAGGIFIKNIDTSGLATINPRAMDITSLAGGFVDLHRQKTILEPGSRSEEERQYLAYSEERMRNGLGVFGSVFSQVAADEAIIAAPVLHSRQFRLDLGGSADIFYQGSFMQLCSLGFTTIGFDKKNQASLMVTINPAGVGIDPNSSSWAFTPGMRARLSKAFGDRLLLEVVARINLVVGASRAASTQKQTGEDGTEVEVLDMPGFRQSGVGLQWAVSPDVKVRIYDGLYVRARGDFSGARIQGTSFDEKNVELKKGESSVHSAGGTLSVGWAL